MDSRMQAKLEAVRRRQRHASLLHGIIFGLAIGSLVALGLESMRRGWNLWVDPWGWASVVVGGLLGALYGWTKPVSENHAAHAIDDRCHLKDRATTALEFSHDQTPSAGEVLAMQDAVQHVDGVDEKLAAPIHLPRQWRTCSVITVAALVVLAWPYHLPEGQAALTPPSPQILNVADKLQADLEKLEELLKEEDSADLEELSTKLKELTEEMKEPGVDLKEALAQLSEMEAAIVQQQADYSITAVDEQLAALGEAMMSIASMEAAGAALSQGKFDEAAEELEKLDELELDEKDREEAKEKLKKLAEAMKAAGTGQLSQATSELSDSVGGGGGGGGVGESGKNLAKQVRKHEKRKSIDGWMMQQLARLSESKGECKGDKQGQCKACNGGSCSSCNKNGGFGNKPSDKESNNWGLGESGNPQGELTSLDAKRNMENITGKQGEGAMDVETIRSIEGKQQAGRQYKDVYNDYQKMSESVLENEPIPLGHRQTIRKYFELIRPENGDAAE